MPFKRGITDDPGIEPESAAKIRPYTEDGDAIDAEGHASEFRPYTEPTGIEPDRAGRYRLHRGRRRGRVEPDGAGRVRP